MKYEGIKCVTVAKLAELLKEIPADLLILPNAVGNLSVITTAGEDYGYIELRDEEFNRV